MGVAHKAKSGEAFLRGHRVAPRDDLRVIELRLQVLGNLASGATMPAIGRELDFYLRSLAVGVCASPPCGGSVDTFQLNCCCDGVGNVCNEQNTIAAKTWAAEDLAKARAKMQAEKKGQLPMPAENAEAQPAASPTPAGVTRLWHPPLSRKFSQAIDSMKAMLRAN